MRFIDLTGKKFKRWKVLGYAGNRHWRCQCRCGMRKIVYGTSLTQGLSKSCGCWRVENGIKMGRATKGGHGNGGTSRTHGEAITRTPEYRCWLSMRNRCSNKNNNVWPRYGGRGIRVCKRWDEYELFLFDMGRKPTALHSIDRINNSGDYKPSNCRWATKKEQVANRRPNSQYGGKPLRCSPQNANRN